MQRTRRVWRGFTSFQRNVLCLLLLLLAVVFTLLYVTSNQQQSTDQQHLKNIHPKFRPKIKTASSIIVPSIVQITTSEVVNVDKPRSVFVGDVTVELNPNQRQRAVIDAMKHSWKAYELYAWGKDEVHPLTKTSGEWMGAGLTLVDALDTLWIMNMKQEFNHATEWVSKTLSFDINKSHTNVFETTIRLLGGLLSAYHLSGLSVFKEKAHDLGERLLPAFQLSTGIPYSDINLHSGVATSPVWTRDSSTAEASTVQLELRELARLTGVRRFLEAADKLTLKFHEMTRTTKDGLVPIYVDPMGGMYRAGATISLGARGDSYYEYLIKQYVQLSKRKSVSYLASDWRTAVDGIRKHLVRYTGVHRLTFVGELLGSAAFSPKMDHLVCFLPGALAYGYLHGMPQDHLDLAKELIKTCYLTYTQTLTGLAPEITYFNEKETAETDMYIKPLDRHNIQRPETIESLFYMWRITGDRKYQDWGWNIFEAFNKYTRLKSPGFVSISDVTNPKDVGYRTKCESFWFSETLKYLFLLFSDNHHLISLDKWVFNTEGHPLPVINGTII